AEVNARIENGTMINLNDGDPAESMASLLKKGMYFEDPKDISFVAASLSGIKHSGADLDNTGALNKKKYLVNADEAFLKGGRSFKRRVQLSRNLLGFSEEDSITYEKEKKHPLAVSSQTGVALGKYTISGTVKSQQGTPAANVLIRLKLLIPQDSSTSPDRD